MSPQRNVTNFMTQGSSPSPSPNPNDVPSGEPGSEICSAELSASADFAVCGRADGAVLLMRYSRDLNP